ncbi:hypothetical protein M5W76_18025 [Paenibacillus larvae]|uniref:hypothetical protein n=1 Tax=Paenibacillus larvae TaxID=1464 RepID=UPI0022803FBB|nr:hypothetical protein [Paenibacillus larvae]MCY9720306.1 hypothetical protein [Paenibacillus larvae]
MIQDTFLKRDDNWRKYVNGLLNGAAKRMNHPYRNLRNKSYDMLEDRGKCRLKIRLENMKDRLEKSGATQTRIEKLNRMDVIEADPHLKEIYTSIVKEISIGSMKGA